MMRTLGVDAANIRGGGGVTHLSGLLREAEPGAAGFGRVIVWAGRSTLDRLEPRPWLECRHVPTLDGGLWARSRWQRTQLDRVVRQAGCHLLFVPGGSYAGRFRPVVALSQNMLPFEWGEARRYGWSLMTAKFLALRVTQTRTFRRADGLLFASEYARTVVTRGLRSAPRLVAVIPHGVDQEFFVPPRPARALHECTPDDPFRLLYVSIIDVYKHQATVAEAVARLRQEGMPIVLELVGPAYEPALRRLRQTLLRVDPRGESVVYRGAVAPGDLPRVYAHAEAFVFASSCENMPIIPLEAMAAGLPIACAARGPMPEVVGDAAEYFDPERVDDVARVLRRLVADPALRTRLAYLASARAATLSWRLCARESLAFMARVADRGTMG